MNQAERHVAQARLETLEARVGKVRERLDTTEIVAHTDDPKVERLMTAEALRRLRALESMVGKRR